MLTHRFAIVGALFTSVLLGAMGAMGCATAVDDTFLGTTNGDASVPHDTAGFDASGIDAPGTDGARGDSVTSTLDTRADKDSGVGTDTAVDEDTYVEPEDTYVEPADTYVPTGGPCGWCAEGSCSAPDEDFDCFYKCVGIEGHWDCRYDKSLSPVCLCTD